MHHQVLPCKYLGLSFGGERICDTSPLVLHAAAYHISSANHQTCVLMHMALHEVSSLSLLAELEDFSSQSSRR